MEPATDELVNWITRALLAVLLAIIIVLIFTRIL